MREMRAVLKDETALLSMAVEILDMEERAKIHLTFQYKIDYLVALMNATLLIDPDKDKNSTAKYELIFRCAAAISLISRSQCEGEDAEQIEAMSAIMFQLYELLSMQLLKTGDGPMTIRHPTATIYLIRLEPEKLNNFVIGAPGNDTYCQLPSLAAMAPFLGDLSNVNVQMYSFDLNLLRGDSNETITDKICSLSLKDENKQDIKLKNMSETVQIFMPRQDDLVIYFNNLTIKKNTVVTSTFNVTEPLSSVIFKMEPSKNVTFEILLAYDRTPNATDNDHSLILSETTGYRWLISPEILGGRVGNWTSRLVLVNYTDGEESMELRFMSFETKCMFWNKANQTWSTNGCSVGLQSEPARTQCLCNHMTFFGSSAFVMPNQVDLSQTAALFAKVSENYVVVVMLSAFFGLYLILLVWAIYADKRAFIKKKMTLLADNHPCAQYYYLLNVQTGHRRGAGTTAQVELALVGVEGQSTRRHFTDPQKPVFERGGVDMFLLATPFPLGDLESIRVRHDNSGKSPDWYLNKVTVQDMQLRKYWHFLCSSWLSSSKGDGITKRTFPSAKSDEITSFRNLFQSRTSSGFRDEHIWVSVVDPPRRSPFTRAQRVSCCMCLLLCTMAINIMFWNKPQNQQSPVIFNIGSLEVTWEDIVIGVESGLLMFPINILIISIFRSIKPRLPQAESGDAAQTRHRVPTIDTFLKETGELVIILSRNTKNKVSPPEKEVETFSDLYAALSAVQEVLQHMPGAGQAEGDDDDDDEDAHWGHCGHFVLHYLCHLQNVLGQIGDGAFSSREDFQWVQNTLSLLQRKAETMYSTHAPRGLNTAPKEEKKAGCWLPWWFVFVGWFLLLSISGISTFFTLLYGFWYGKESSTQWAMSLALSLFQSIFILQPLKVIGVAIFFALILKTVTVDESEEVDFLLKEQQERCESFSQMSRL
ncbi:polycystin-1-like protein 2 [Conger conger]|uniref:polycystin-1-like protein 2 n=1 Tax=Conger conger TaxID=82655 RepID=UPI002A59DDA5|nr:polycystin-1-like protein 2 [Conger conger]